MMRKENLFMNEFLEDRIYDAAQVCGFTTFFREDSVYFEAHSPLGEDISIEIEYDAFPFIEDMYIKDKDAYVFKVIVRELSGYFKCFNADAHEVELWNLHGTTGAPTDLQKLLDDAKEIKKMYKMLYVYLDDLHKELEEE